MNIAKLVSLGLMTVLLQDARLVLAAESAHEHHQTEESTLTLDHGKRWETDAALRDGMSAMREAMAAQLPAIHHNTLDAAGYASLASKLEPALAGIFANCHLPPAADAQLHNVLLPISAAIDRMKKAETAEAGHDAALGVISGFEDYGRAFDHPGWQSL